MSRGNFIDGRLTLPLWNIFVLFKKRMKVWGPGACYAVTSWSLKLWKQVSLTCYFPLTSMSGFQLFFQQQSFWAFKKLARTGTTVTHRNLVKLLFTNTSLTKSLKWAVALSPNTHSEKWNK